MRRAEEEEEEEEGQRLRHPGESGHFWRPGGNSYPQREREKRETHRAMGMRLVLHPDVKTSGTMSLPDCRATGPELTRRSLMTLTEAPKERNVDNTYVLEQLIEGLASSVAGAAKPKYGLPSKGTEEQESLNLHFKKMNENRTWRFSYFGTASPSSMATAEALVETEDKKWWFL
ncbi:hypothetical protein JRQ81_016982 [Phrynocephalus forsythii]|uniref:Uncharacterized protein n=1 Tax=Phrynocephalus forsythii TaxID=171643 RepID=A0A9Q0XTX0_9SAUR|nr:hypothetical protein JRQ81_016982 [Phrynocephalus forsythii]